MQLHINLFIQAILSIQRNRARSFVVIGCLLAVLVPFVTAMAVSEGVREQSFVSIDMGADLYITRAQYGRNGPIKTDKVTEFLKIPGVTKVIPRISGRTYIGEDLALVVGIDSPELLSSQAPPLASGEVLMGRVLAEHLELKKGDELRFFLFPAMPFTIVDLIDGDLSIWASSMIVMPFNDAATIFKLPGFASEILIYARPGTTDKIAEHLSSLGKPWDMTPPLRIQTKSIVNQYINRGFDLQSGVFFLFYLTAFALSIPALLILSGFGRGARKKEIGILKATGWQTLEVMEMTCMENVLLAISGSMLSVVIGMIWLKLGNGIGIAPLFISGISWIPEFPVPSRFTPMPVLFSFLFGIILTMVGTVFTTWKTAITPPLTTMS
ncbi:MAG: ABC transporter permease [Desulfocapsa sp.]|nr:ABC transporter permease [Desulfocapsa sp.]